MIYFFIWAFRTFYILWFGHFGISLFLTFWHFDMFTCFPFWHYWHLACWYFGIFDISAFSILSHLGIFVIIVILVILVFLTRWHYCHFRHVGTFSFCQFSILAFGQFCIFVFFDIWTCWHLLFWYFGKFDISAFGHFDTLAFGKCRYFQWLDIQWHSVTYNEHSQERATWIWAQLWRVTSLAIDVLSLDARPSQLVPIRAVPRHEIVASHKWCGIWM